MRPGRTPGLAAASLRASASRAATAVRERPVTKTVKTGVCTPGKSCFSASLTRIEGLPGTSQPPPERCVAWCSENQAPDASSAIQTAKTAPRRRDTTPASRPSDRSTITRG